MGLGIVPRVRVSGAGEQVINRRLIEWERVDAAGGQSDVLTLTIDTADKQGLPKEGARLNWFEGYDDKLVDKGAFIITRVRSRLYPPVVTIFATAAPFTIADKTGFKARKTRSYSQITLANLFRQLASEHGFSPRVAPDFEHITLAHVDQLNESDSAFLTRLAYEHDAVIKPVNTLFVLAKRGQMHTITGQALPAVELSVPSRNTPDHMHQFISCEWEQASRQHYLGVQASWVDCTQGQELCVHEGQAPFKVLTQLFAHQAQAKQACRAELQRLQRQGTSICLDVPGTPYLVAEGLLCLDDSFPAEMMNSWSIDKVIARGDASGRYRCAVVAAQLINA